MEGTRAPTLLRFGSFEVNLSTGELRHEGLRVRLPDQSFHILAMLLERPGELILREAIQKRLWPNDTVVEFESSINAAVRRLRLALSDSADTPRFIETLARRGYRFIGQIQHDDASGAGAAAQSPQKEAVQGESLAEELADSALSLGRKVAGRYRIEEFLGRGAFGKVYRAHDDVLNRPVALKTFELNQEDSPGRMEAVLAEARTIAKLDHDNIVSVFDAGHEGNAAWIVMRLVEGEGLNRVLAREGRFERHRAARLLRQISKALDHAHRKGIIHRDVKPSNILVEKREDGSEHAWLADFGIAQMLAGAPLKERLVAGTPSYMSPEQIAGKRVDARTDIFAVGCVAYELISGRRAFPAETQTEMKHHVIHDQPELMSQLPSLAGEKLASVCRRALAEFPEDRYQTAEELLKELEGVERGEGDGPVRAARGLIVKVFRTQQPVRRFTIIATLALSLVVMGVGLYKFVAWKESAAGIYQLRAPRTAQQTVPSEATGLPPGPIHARRSVAVLGCRNLSGRGDTVWLSTALSEMLTTELAAGEKLRTIAGENVVQMKVNLSLAETDSYSKETLARIRSNLGADLVVVGAYLALGEKGGGQIRLDLRVQDAAGGETLAVAEETGTEAKLFELVSEAGERLREKLGVGEMTAAEADTVKASLPTNPEAARLYSEGLAKLRLFDALAARDLLEKAVAADPHYALAHSALASAWHALGYDTKAQEEAKRAFALSANLSRQDRLLIEGVDREMSHEPEKAVEVYRILWGYFPDNPDYGIHLAHAQASAGELKEVMPTIDALRKLPSPAGDDPRIDIQEGIIAESLSDFKRELAAAGRAAAKGQSHGARLLVAQARLLQASAHRNLGQYEEARSALEEGKKIFVAAGDRHGEAQALNWIAMVLQEHGNLEAAREAYQESLEAFRKTGSKEATAGVLNNLASLLQAEGKLSEAKRMYQESLGIGQEIGNKIRRATALGNIATVFQAEGNLHEAQRAYEGSLKMHREIGDKRSAAIDLSNLGVLADAQGDLSGAKNFAEGALKLDREIGNKDGMADVLRNMAGFLTQQGNLVAARNRADESMAMYQELGNRSGVSDDLTILATVLMEEGRFVEAKTKTKQAAQEYSAEKDPDDEACALCILAESLLRLRKVVEAQSTMDRATMLAEKSESRETRLCVAITGARVLAAKGKPAEAIKSLENVLAEAAKLGRVDMQFESRLALGEIEMKSGNPTAGRARLATLQKEAQAKGYGLVVRKAANFQKILNPPASP